MRSCRNEKILDRDQASRRAAQPDKNSIIAFGVALPSKTYAGEVTQLMSPPPHDSTKESSLAHQHTSSCVDSRLLLDKNGESRNGEEGCQGTGRPLTISTRCPPNNNGQRHCNASEDV